MSEQDGRQATTIQRPPTNDPEEWKAYWKAQGEPWRTEPEIDAERQKYLASRRNITPDIEQGIYPFKDIKLSRADLEWLLATHQDGLGPVNWKDPSQRYHEGLELRGANLRGIDLSGEYHEGFPLTRMRAGLTLDEWNKATLKQREAAVVHLEGAKLKAASMERVRLKGCHLEGADLRGVHLEGASVEWAHLEGVNLNRAHLEGADLFETHLEGKRIHLNELEQLRKWMPDFPEVLPPADLRSAFFDADSTLRNATFGDGQYGFISVADVRWDGVNLAVLKWPRGKWTKLLILGDEREARQAKKQERLTKDKISALTEYEAAIRANRQLAVVLRDQGLNEEADHFAYRAQKLQRIVLRRQRQFGRYLFLGFLDVLAGYGYRPGRSVFWYFAIVCGFALAYHIFGQLSLFPPDAFIYSLTSFHGRGFFPGLEHRTSLHDPLIMLAALEAVVGLFIEISFIATFTQRFFGR